jgi:GT2 family glycosyltransferase
VDAVDTARATVSVVIPSHDPARFPMLAAVVAAARAQTRQPDEIVVVVDHNEELFDRASRELTGVTVLGNRYGRGVSGNRNTGAEHTASTLVAFLDDDVEVGPDWLGRLIEPFADPRVVGTGGAITPIWPHRREWVPAEFLWAYGASYVGMPTRTTIVRNVWSASMVVRRDAFNAVGGFRTDFGKIGDRSQPEDTELCIRMAQANEGFWVYVPDAVIGHHVTPDRNRVGYFLTRCYREGRGKVAMARLPRNTQRPADLSHERRYLTRVLPRAVWRGLADTVTGRDPHGAARSAAVVMGVTAAAIGGATELLRG